MNLRLSNSNHNVVSRNKIGAPMTVYMGVYVAGNSSYNVFYDNIIAGYTRLVSFRGSSVENNTFYRNSFIGKYEDLPDYAYIDNLAGNVNSWDNGREGNFWDNYNGTDSNGDGIGDTPYVIDEDNIDYYPLMYPYDVENDAVVLPPLDLLPAVLAAAALTTAAVVAVSLIIYFRKRKHQTK